MKRLYFVLIVIVLLSGCNNTQGFYESSPILAEKSISYSMVVDTLKLEPPAYSGSGFFRVRNDSIYLFDLIYLVVNVFDREGTYQYSRLGGGNGPDQIESFVYHSFLPDGSSLFLGSGYNLELFDKNWKRIRPTYFLDFYHPNGFNKSIADYAYNYSDYDLIFNNTLTISPDAKTFVIPITINPRLNPSLGSFQNPNRYFKMAHSIGLCDVQSGQVMKTFAPRPPIFTQSANLHIYDQNVFSFTDESLLVTSKPDSLIRVFSPDGSLFKYSFGRAGNSITSDFIRVKDFNQLRENWDKAHETTSYNYSIFSDKKFVFRSYTRYPSNTGGLQVYENHVLVGDFGVYPRFNIIGKINSHYLADGIMDEANEKAYLFRFQLHKSNPL